MSKVLTLACMLLASGITHKFGGQLHSYTLRNDSFYSSFYIAENHASINLSTAAHIERYSGEPKGFNVNLVLFSNNSAILQYVDENNNLHQASLKSIIEAANAFEKAH